MATVRTRWSRTVVVLAALTAGLGACAGQPGTAATVDGDVITEAELAETVREVNLFTTATPADVLMLMIASPFIVDAGADAGMAVSEQEALEFFDASATAAGLDPAELSYGPGIVLIGQGLLVERKAEQAGQGAAIHAEAVAQLGEADVVVSPRHGTWDPATSSIAALEQPWIISATPTA